MKIAFAADDTNECTETVLERLRQHGEVIVPDVGDMWFDLASAVTKAVVDGTVDYGVLMCWTGTGVAIAANKVKGIRAATVHDAWTAKGSRLWNDANVMTMSLKRVAPDVAAECVDAFLTTEPDPDETESINLIRD